MNRYLTISQLLLNSMNNGILHNRLESQLRNQTFFSNFPVIFLALDFQL